MVGDHSLLAVWAIAGYKPPSLGCWVCVTLVGAVWRERKVSE